MNTMTPSIEVALARPSMLRIYLLEGWFEFLRILRTPAFVVPTLTFPVVFYVLFALLIPGQWGSYQKSAYLFATYCTFGVIGPALFGFGVGMAMERQQGWLELKRVSPMPTGAYFCAKIIMSLAFALAVVLLLSIAAIGFGDVRISVGTWFTLTGALLLGTLPFCALGLWIGALVKGEAAVAVVNLIYLPMTVLSGLWIPLFVFPALMQKLAVLWPAWHLGQMALGIVGQIPDVPYLLHAGAMLAMTMLFLSLAALRLRNL